MAATLIINPHNRDTAKEWIDKAPEGSVITFARPKRTTDQNALLWARLTELSQQKPQGIEQVPEVWKLLIMKACGHEVQFVMGLDGQPFPAGFRSSKLDKEQMGQLLDFIEAWGAENGVEFSEVAA